MWNVAGKSFIIAALAVLASCGKSDSATEAAQALLAEATQAVEVGDYALAQSLLDSLNAAYPAEVEVRKSALELQPRIVEGSTMQEVADLQAQQQSLAQYVDSLKRYFNETPVGKDVFEAYWTHKDFPADWRERNTAVARVTQGGGFVVISSLGGTSAHHTALRLSANGSDVTSGAVAYNPERGLSRESVRFPSEKADTLGAFALTADGGAATLHFVGGNKAPSAKLSAKEVHALADSYRLSQAMRTLQANARILDQLKAKIQVARDQSARLNK